MKDLNRDQVKKDIKQFLCEIMDLDEQSVKDEDYIIETLGANSFAIAEIFIFLQEEYNLSLEENFMLGKPICINDIADIVLETTKSN